MLDNQNEPSAAKLLAAIVTDGVNMSSVMASVQRSHRFPLHIFAQIENMAKMAGVSVSVIINQLLEVGLEGVMRELSEDTNKQLSLMTQAQLDRPSKAVRVNLKNRNS